MINCMIDSKLTQIFIHKKTYTYSYTIKFFIIFILILLFLLTTCQTFKNTIDRTYINEIVEYSNSLGSRKKIKCLLYFSKIYYNKNDLASLIC